MDGVLSTAATQATLKNIEANPRVRVRTGGEWRQGSAHLLDDDDPVARLKALWGNAGNALPVRMFGTDLLTIRIDLDTPDQCRASRE